MRSPYILRHGQLYPVIPLTAAWAGRAIDTYTLVDSGASVSLFRSEMAEALGLDLDRGEAVELGGVGGSIPGFQHVVTVRMDTVAFDCHIVFSRHYTGSFNIIGRQDFFRRFLITFDEAKGEVILEET